MKKEMQKLFEQQETMVAELMDSFGFGKAFLKSNSKDLALMGQVLESYKGFKDSMLAMAAEEDECRASTAASFDLLTKLVQELRSELREVNSRLASLQGKKVLDEVNDEVKDKMTKADAEAKARDEIPTYKMSDFESLSE